MMRAWRSDRPCPWWIAVAALVASAGCADPGGTVDAGGGAPDAPGLDAPGLDAPGLDAPGLDALGSDAALDASGLDVGTPPVVDDDRDDDGIPDLLDAFPDDAREWEDSDADGVGNVADADEDGDGTPDLSDARPFDASSSTLAPTSISPTLSADAAPSLASLPARFSISVGGTEPELAHVAFDLAEPSGLLVRIEGTGAATASVFVYQASTLVYPHRETSGPARELDYPLEAGRAVIGIDVAGHARMRHDFVVSLWPDADLDGIDDDRERALGLRPFDADSDDDGVPDGQELLAMPDADGDGVPAFLDLDSDGDGLADRAEGAVDDDADGLPALSDLDSDGDGSDDGGSDPHEDLDGDGRPDYVDVDDDGDGVPDGVDASPGIAATVDPDPRTGISIETVYTEIGGERAPEALVPGEVLVITGVGLDGAGSEQVAFGVGGPRPVLVAPASVSATEIRVVAPPLATSPIRVVRGGLASDVLEVARVDVAAGQPLLFEQPLVTAFPTPLRGRNLERIVSMQLGAQRFSPAFEAGVAVIQSGGSGLLRVESLDGLSNTVALRMTSPIFPVPVSLPPGSTIDPSTFVVGGTLEDAPDPGGGSLYVPRLATPSNELVTAITVDGLGPGRDCMTLGAYAIDQVAPVLDAASTATALGLLHTNALRRVQSSAAETVRGRVAALTETASLATLIEARLAADVRCPLEAPDAAIEGAIVALVVAVENDLAAGLADGSLTAPGIPDLIREPLPVRAATITPEQFDVAVLQTRNSENVEIENDTSMSLSARIRTWPEGELLAPHVASFFDRAIIGGQSGLLTGYRASTSSFAQPRARTARVDVITPGLLDPGPTDAAGRDAQWYLAFRTIIEGILLPILDAALGELFPLPGAPSRGQVIRDALAHLLLQQGYSAVLDARAAYESDDLTGALRNIVNILERDLNSVGPITRGLAQLVGGTFTARLGRRLAARLVPVLGQIAAIADVAATVATATNVGKVVNDLLTTPGVLTYDVEFGFGVERVEPQVLERAFRPATVVIRGSGFWREEAGARVAPRVRVRDGGGGAERMFEVTSMNLAGTRLEAVLPREYMATARGPLFFTVDRGGELMEHPVGVAVEQNLRIAASAPDPIGPSERLLLSGAGFGHDPRRTRVWFYGTDGAGTEIQLRGRVVEHTHHELAVITPSGLAVDRTWEVEVDVTDPSGALLTSNRHLLNPRCADVAHSVWDMTILYDLCTQPRLNRGVVVFDLFEAPWAPGSASSGNYLTEGEPSLIGVPFSTSVACQPPARFAMRTDIVSVGYSLPPSQDATRVVVEEPYPVQGVLSPDGNTLRWFYGTIDGCTGTAFFPLVPDRVVMTRRQ